MWKEEGNFNFMIVYNENRIAYKREEGFQRTQQLGVNAVLFEIENFTSMSFLQNLD